MDGVFLDNEPWRAQAILLVDLDAFFASVEQLDHPGWRGKPVIVGGDPARHGVVSTCSYEARAFGVRSALPSSTAKKLCPHAIWTRGHFARYTEMSQAVMDILREETPHVQQVSIDEAFLNVTPTKVNTEHPVAIAARIQKRVEELGITCSIGVGTSKTIAKIASDMDKPRGLTVVYPGGERDFLAPLPVRAMSGIGKATEDKLKSMGIRTLGQLADANPDTLVRAFGKMGEVLSVRARGGDDAPVEQDDTVKSVSNAMTFAIDLETKEEAFAALATVAAKVGRRLRQKNLRGKTLGLRVRFADRSVKSVQCQLVLPSDDESDFMPPLKEMLSEIWRPGAAVRLLGVSVSDFCEEAYVQESLFPECDDEKNCDGNACGIGFRDAKAPSASSLARQESKRKLRKLIEATDLVRNRFGEDSVRYGRELRTLGNTTGTNSKNGSSA